MNKKLLKRIGLIGTLGITLTSISVTGYFAHNLYHQFHQTKKWKRMSKTPFAELTPELLSADDSIKDLIQEYNQEEALLWDKSNHTLKIPSKKASVEHLQKLYKKLPESYQKTLTQYPEIVTLHQINQTLQAFKKDGIPEKKSLKDIQDYLRSSFDALYPYLIENQHKGAEDMYSQLQKLANDSNQYAIVLDTINQDYKLDKNRLKTDMVNQHVQYLNDTLSKLHYKWGYIEKVIKPLIQKSADAVKSNESAADKYAKYLKDQEAKADFEQFESAYVAEQNRLKSLIIDLPDFTNKSFNDLSVWVSQNNMTLKVLEKDDSSKPYNIVLEQTPAKNKYDKIVKGSTITVTINKKKVVQPTLPSSTVPDRETDTSSSSSTPTVNDTQPSSSETETSTYVRPTAPTITRPNVPN